MSMTSLWRADGAVVAGSPFEPGQHREVLVVGAGITGLSTALHARARAGWMSPSSKPAEVGNLATGGNTGKLSLLQGKVLSTLRRHHSGRARARLCRRQSRRRTMAHRLRRRGRRRRTPGGPRTPTRSRMRGVHDVEAEFAAAHEAGLAVRRVLPDEAGRSRSSTRSPSTTRSRSIRRQSPSPWPVRSSLPAARCTPARASLHVQSCRARCVETTAGFASARSGGARDGRADHRIAASTSSRPEDCGRTASRSTCRERCPMASTCRSDGPTRSLRSVTSADGPAELARLVVGGNGHPVGRADSERALVDDLIDWTRRNFPGAEPQMSWSAQDYESHDLIPFVGAMPRSLGRDPVRHRIRQVGAVQRARRGAAPDGRDHEGAVAPIDRSGCRRSLTG